MREIEDKSDFAPLLQKVKQIDQHRPGLGFISLYAYAGRLGALRSPLGRGFIVCGPKSWGKAQIVSIGNQDVLGDILETDDYVGKRWLNGRINEGIAEGRPLKKISIAVEDLTQATSEYYWFLNTFNILSTLLSEKKFGNKRGEHRGRPGSSDRAYRFESVSAMLGCTHRTMWRIRKHYNWDEQWTDRFTVMAILYTHDDLQRQAAYHRLLDEGKIKVVDVEAIAKKWIRKIPAEIPFAVSTEQIDRTYTVMFSDQNTYKRGREFLKSDLRGLAMLAGTNEVTESILAYAELMAPYFRVGAQSARRIQLIQWALVNGPKWRTRDLLPKMGWHDARHLVEHAWALKRKGLLSVHEARLNPLNPKIIVGDQLSVGLNTLESLRSVPV